MSKRFIQVLFLALTLVAVLAVTDQTQAQSTPNPSALNRPDYNHSEANGCTRCHFQYNPDGSRRGPHMIEAVGVNWDDTKKTFSFSGKGWFASKHAESNYKSTQNTYCAKCHSPLQAKPEASFKKGRFSDTEQVADGKMEGVTCAACHPSHTVAVEIGRRLGIYQIGKDKTKAEGYQVVHHGEEDQLCLGCHVERHSEEIPPFKLMYDVGVRCIDCHMAPYGNVEANPAIHKVAHDFKVAANLPFSCGVQGSVVTCHPGMTPEGTLRFIPLMKEQHKSWWSEMGGKKKKANLTTSADYMQLWQEIEAEVKAAGE
jgi:hypothetical protein